MLKSKKLDVSIPFVQAHHIGRRQRPTAILLRASFTTGDKGAALGIANAWTSSYNKAESCHYVIDESKVYQCVPDRVEAKPLSHPELWRGAISINVCYDPPNSPEPLVVHRAALLTARLCTLYKIRPRTLSHSQRLMWQKHTWRRRGGIILKTARGFPADEFFELFAMELKQL